MQITLYTQTKPYNSIVRNMTAPVTITGVLRNACDILNVEIEIEYNAVNITKNYAYIPDFGRYYYFRKPPTIEGKRIVLHLHGDSLYNFRNNIYNSYCVAERSSSNYDLMLPDSVVMGEQGYTIFNRVLPYKFHPEQGEYILTIAGGI